MHDTILALSAISLVSIGPIHAEQLTVASWNLSHFSGADGMGCKPRTQAAYDSIRNIINAVDADIWLFQEVDTAGSLARVMDTSIWQLQTESRPDHLPAGKCSGGDNDRTMQRTIIAIKKRIPVIATRDLSFLDVSGYGALRHGVAVTVQLGTQPVEVVNVHLKAGCSEGADGEACATLFQQIPYLAAYAGDLETRNIPVLIGGDFNRRLSEPGDAVMNTLGFNDDLGLSIMSHSGTSKCSLKAEAAIDYQIASKAFSELTTDIDAYEHSFSGPFAEWPSDHCPNVVRYSF